MCVGGSHTGESPRRGLGRKAEPLPRGEPALGNLLWPGGSKGVPHRWRVGVAPSVLEIQYFSVARASSQRTP